MSSPPTSRNAPCPCGSGRKHKLCCLQVREAADSARVRVRRAEGHAVETLLRFTAQTFGNTFVHRAWADFFVETDVPEDLFATPEFDTMFVPWLTLGFVRDEDADGIEPGWPAQPVGLHWLETHRGPIDQTERAFILAACRSPMSVFVVEAADPGVSLDIKDVLTGRAFHVLEQSASRSLQPADLCFTRVVTVGDVRVMFGGAPLVVPPDWHTRIIDWREQTFGKRLATRQQLADFDIEIRELYLQIAEQVRHPAPMKLRNTDGDDLEPTQMTFDLAVPVAVAFEKLRSLAVAKDGDHTSDETYDESGVMTGATVSWVKDGNRQQKDWTNTVLGSLVLAPGTLTADANSKRRADRLGREIARRLGRAATLRERTVMNVDGMLAARAEARAEGTPVASETSDERPAEFREIEEAAFRQHLTAWADARVPALGNRTPRQAVRTPGGRERVEAILAQFARTAGSRASHVQEVLAELRANIGLQ